MSKIGTKNINNYIKYSPIIICILMIIMSIGYAIVNSINLTISGSSSAQLPNDIYISQYSYSSENNEKVIFNNVGATMINSTIELNNVPTSSVIMDITFANPTSNTYYLNDVNYAEELVSSDSNIYSNENITYTYSTNVDSLKPGEKMIVTLLFKYEDETNIANTSLNSILNFLFTKSSKITNLISSNDYLTTYETEQTEEGIVFNSEDSYATFINNNPTYPLSYSVTFKTNSSTGIIFGDYASKAAIGFNLQRIIINLGDPNSSTYSTLEYYLDSELLLDTWYTFDIVYESILNHRLFLNGEEITARTSRSNYWAWGNETSYIGMRPTSGSYTAYNFNGVIKRFLVYNKQLTEEEINQNYNAQSIEDIVNDSLSIHYEFSTLN